MTAAKSKATPLSKTSGLDVDWRSKIPGLTQSDIPPAAPVSSKSSRSASPTKASRSCPSSVAAAATSPQTPRARSTSQACTIPQSTKCAVKISNKSNLQGSRANAVQEGGLTDQDVESMKEESVPLRKSQNQVRQDKHSLESAHAHY